MLSTLPYCVSSYKYLKNNFLDCDWVLQICRKDGVTPQAWGLRPLRFFQIFFYLTKYMQTFKTTSSPKLLSLFFWWLTILKTYHSQGEYFSTKRMKEPIFFFSEARRVYEVGMPVKRSKLTIDNPWSGNCMSAKWVCQIWYRKCTKKEKKKAWYWTGTSMRTIHALQKHLFQEGQP